MCSPLQVLHGDPHGGNILYIANPRGGGAPKLGLIDYGQVKYLTEKQRLDTAKSYLLVQAATLWRVGREMSHRQLGTHDLYHAFNGKRDGYLTCGELAASRSAGGASRGRGAPLQACSGPSP